MSADCGEKQFDFFTSLVLDFSLYLGFTLLTVMIAIGLYFFLKYCCCKRCRKRWVRPRQGQSSLIRRVILMFRDRHAFSGIRSQPSFVATIQFAFSSNLITFTEIGKRLLSPNKNNVGNLFLIPSPPTTTQSKSFLNKNFDKKNILKLKQNNFTGFSNTSNSSNSYRNVKLFVLYIPPYTVYYIPIEYIHLSPNIWIFVSLSKRYYIGMRISPH